MKNISSALASLLASRQFFEAELFTITPGAAQNLLKNSQNIYATPWAAAADTLTNPSITGATAVGFAATDPNGLKLASAVTFAATGSGFYNDWGQDVAGLPCLDLVYTFSVWVRVTSGTATFQLHMRDVSPITQNVAGPNLTATTSWQRFSVTLKFINDSGTGVRVAVRSPTSNPGITLLLWGAQLEMRGSPGAYVAAGGVNKWGNYGPLPEPVRVTSCDRDVTWQGKTYISGSAQNLLCYSQDLEAPTWIRTTGVTVTPNSQTAPDGTVTADSVAYNGSGAAGDTRLYQSLFVTPPLGTPLTVSMWLKAAAPLTLRLGTNFGYVTVNVTTVWQRFSVSNVLNLVGGLAQALINSAVADNAAFTVYAWGAQVELADTVGRYLPTYLIPQQGIGKVSRGGLSWGVGLTVDTLDLTYDAPQLAAQLVRGHLDGARVQVDRLYGTSFGSWTEALTLFTGNVADADAMGRTRAVLHLRSRLDLLNSSLPRIVIQPSCPWSLYDTGCQLYKATQGSVDAVQAGTTLTMINTGFTASAGYGDLGTLTFLSGVNAGLTVTIKRWLQPGGAAQVFVSAPLPFVPAVGDKVVVFPGCDKMQVTCDSKFGNLIHFGGMPYVPVPEAAL